MFIGLLDKVKSVSYTHVGTSIPFPPSSESAEGAFWAWNYAYDSAIDAHYELDGECFIGAVTVKLSEDSIVGADILVDGKISGTYNAKTAEYVDPHANVSGNYTGGNITIPVGVKGTRVTVRLHTSLLNLTLYGIEAVTGAQLMNDGLNVKFTEDLASDWVWIQSK